VHEMADPGARYVPDVAGHCRFCFHRGSCPAYADEARPILGDALLDALGKVGASPDVDILVDNLPAAAKVVDLAKALVPKKSRAPRRKYSPAYMLTALDALLDGVGSGNCSPMDDYMTVSITAVEQLLRDTLNYTKEDLFDFWKKIEADGGRVS